MNNTEKNHVLDGVMAGLVMLGCPVAVGIPAWMLKEMTTRTQHLVSPREVLGLSNSGSHVDMVEEYLDNKGYQFSWGTVTERLLEIEDFPPFWKFEITPYQVLKRFSQPAMLQDLFIYMYRHHPLRHSKFYPDESYGSWTVMAFEVEIDDVPAFRHWMGTVFLRKIIPDLLGEAMLIVDRKSTVERCVGVVHGHSLIEEERFQLCGDPKMFSFNVRKE